MSGPKLKPTTKNKAASPLMGILAIRTGAPGVKSGREIKPGFEKVTVVTGSASKPRIKLVSAKKSLFTTYPSERSIEFMKRSDAATSAGNRSGGRRYGG